MEGTFKVDYPGVFLRHSEYVTLLSGLDDFVFEDHLRFFEFFNGNGFAGFVPLAESDLTEGSFTDDFKGCEIHDGDFGALDSEDFSLLMDDFLFDLVLFCIREMELFHFFVELIPIVTFFSLLL